MTKLLAAGVILAFTSFGCSGPATLEPSQPPGWSVVTSPANLLTGRVVGVNRAGRFVILSFPIGQMPGLEQRMNVYQSGMKVGEVKITGPQRDDKIVADIMQGDAAPGDEVRDR